MEITDAHGWVSARSSVIVHAALVADGQEILRDIFSTQLVYIGCGKCGEADSTVINHAAAAEFWGTTTNNQLTGDF